MTNFRKPVDKFRARAYNKGTLRERKGKENVKGKDELGKNGKDGSPS